MDLNHLRKWNAGLWLVTHFFLLMKKVREQREKEQGRERESKQRSHRGRIVMKNEKK